MSVLSVLSMLLAQVLMSTVQPALRQQAHDPATTMESPGWKTRSVRGRVIVRGRRTPVEYATISLSDGSLVGHTDSFGSFDVQVPVNERQIRVFSIGYKRARVAVVATNPSPLLIRLDPLPFDELTTRVKAPTAPREGPATVMAAQELREAPGTLGDPIRAVAKLPGVTTVMSAVPYPAVRGTQPGATAYYFDGVRVPVLFHLLAGPSVIHPDLVESIELLSGNLPLSMGRATGGAVDVRLAAPKDELFRGTVSIDLLNTSAYVERYFPETQTAVAVAGRFSYAGLLLAGMANLTSDSDGGSEWNAGFWDYQLRVDQKVGPGALRLFVFGSSDDVTLIPRRSDLSQPTAQVGFHRADLRYQQKWGGGGFEVATTVGHDLVGLRGERDGVPDGEASTREIQVSGRVSMHHQLVEALRVEAGADAQRRWGTVVLDGIVPDEVSSGVGDGLSAPRSIGTFSGAWMRLPWSPLKAWRISPGVRVDAYHLQPATTLVAVEPRLGTTLALGTSWSLSGSVGLAHQPPSVTLPLPVMAVAGLRYGLQRALQTSVGVAWRPAESWDFAASTYVDWLERTVEFDVWDVLNDRRRGSLPAETDPKSSGHAWGVTLMTSRQTAQWSARASYAYQQSRRLTSFAVYDDHGQQVDTRTELLPFAFERRHSLNASGTWRWSSGWSLGGSVTLLSGRPESGVLTSRTRRPAGSAEEGWTWTRTSLDEVDRLPAFFRIDARVSRTWTMDDFLLEAYLDVYNLSFTNEVLGYDYRIGGQGPENPSGPWRTPITGSLIVLPMLGVKAVF